MAEMRHRASSSCDVNNIRAAVGGGGWNSTLRRFFFMAEEESHANQNKQHKSI